MKHARSAIASMVALLVFAMALRAQPMQASTTHARFFPSAIWPDTTGAHINAHGGGLLVHDGAVYWFGETRLPRGSASPTKGVACYSSTDLYNWKNHGIVLPVVTGLRVGLYYSPMDWRFPGYFKPKELVRSALVMKAQGYGQVRELMSLYGRIDILWYDGGWLAQRGSDADAAWFWEPLELNEMARSFQPNVVISSRSGWVGDFDCEEGEREIKGPIRSRPWEKCIRLNTRTWGYTKGETLLSAEQCIAHLVNAACRNGNLLLNVGPDPDGVIPPTQVAVLNQIGQWMQSNGEAIYGTRAGPFEPVDGVYGSTCRENVVYVHILSWPRQTLKLPALVRKVVAARTVGGAEVRAAQSAGGIEIDVPQVFREKPVTIVKLELDGTATELAEQEEQR